uniref:Dystroglycan n=1 Tax=Aceria tosichella TaxID=561515 RepID=A0A6G1SL23_9ACAR
MRNSWDLFNLIPKSNSSPMKHSHRQHYQHHNYHARRLITKSYVPYHQPLNLGFIFYFFLVIITSKLFITIQTGECSQDKFINNAANNAYNNLILSTSEPDLFATSYLHDTLQVQQAESVNYPTNYDEPHSGSSSIIKSTPPLAKSFQNFYSNDNALAKQHIISPRAVFKANYYDSSFSIASTDNNEPFSPLFEYHSADAQQQYMQQDSIQHPYHGPPPLSDGANLLDWIEPGSGAGGGYDSVPFDRSEDSSSSLNNEYSPTPSVVLNNPMMTPLFEQMPKLSDNPPILMRRLPRLVGTAGSPWRYKIPSSTFQDEDGDLRHLRTSLIMKQFIKSEYHNNNISQLESNDVSMMKNLQWLQYDQSSQTLYGFPTEDDIGLNIFLIVVSDRWGSSSNETIRIAIRPHQSSRAITHSIRISGIELANQRRSSIPEVLMDLVKSLSEGVFADRSGKNLIIQSYTLANTTTSSNDVNYRSGPVISIAWFNSSFPVHPCDLAGIETIFRALVDDRQLSPDWSLLSHGGNSDYSPSQALIKSLSPDFRPSSVRINLLGACESKRSSSDGQARYPISTEAGLKTRTRLGKLKWKLGQPIMYQIPVDVFTADEGSRSTRNLSLNLHTIDGKTLDQDPGYNFLEFEQETQTIFGLPYDLTKHVGSKELLLTARHPITDQRIHETFIIDIEPQDLTTINNRAFRVSLYFLTRINIFGPREHVMLSRRMVTALDVADLNYGYEEYADFTIIAIQKFTTGSYIDNSASLSDPANSWKYQDKIFPLDDSSQMTTKSTSDSFTTRDVTSSDGTIFYKLTWTNETIGRHGDCPVEVIKENILYTLERSMIDYIPPSEDFRPEDPAKNASIRFYERLREYFEPAIDLIHLRFEPMSACIDALELHDVGNSDLADIVDKAEDMQSSTEAPLPTILTKPLEAPKMKEVSPINSDEYWAIVVLIILVVAIFFVVMMLIMGLHTYRINQEKRFELQMKLAQARQNSMYLSSMVLADQLQPNDLAGGQQLANIAKPIYLDERTSRKPVILDNEKELLANGSGGSNHSAFYKPTSVTLTGQTIQTAPLKPNMTFTMDSIANIHQQNNTNLASMCPPDTMMAAAASQHMFLDEHQRQRSMTLNRRTTNSTTNRPPLPRQASSSHLSHSQSIITVASIAPQVSFVPHSQANAVPFVYAPMPVFYESAAEQPPYEL